MMRQYELVEKVMSYDPASDEDQLNKAYVYAMKMHGTQKRASGDPYYSHPVEVAGILTDLKLDGDTIITALLHDVVEDTEAELEDIERLFGSDICNLVDGVTKLATIKLKSEQSKQAENFRKLVVAMASDIRVLLVKLADRLHNMRTLHYIKKSEKRSRIALETMEIYAPLAARLGLHAFKDELEDLAFTYLHKESREQILAQLDKLVTSGRDLELRIIKELKKTLNEAGVEAHVLGRVKTPYSIWRKMQKQNVAFEKLGDIVAFRVIVHSVADCYGALGLLHAQYNVIQDRLKDYISTPKPNGYRSIHTGLIGPDSQRIEVQIRTREMHEINEFGVAAHWQYKTAPDEKAKPKEGETFRWIQEIMDILQDSHSSEEFLEHTKLALYQEHVFCFTPKGDLISLPRGATPIDFAYAIHSAIGNKCVGAKVNDKMVQLRTVLENGDIVEVITSKAQRPSPDWENIAITGKARSAIRRFIRQEQRDQYISLGKEMLDKTFKSEGVELTEKALQGVVSRFKVDNLAEMHLAVGQSHVAPRDVLYAIYPGLKEAVKPSNKVVNYAKSRKSKSSDHSIKIKGLIPGMAVHYAKCCHPLPGDRIIGIVTTGKGITVHTADCDSLVAFEETPERWVDLSWTGEEDDQQFIGRLKVIVNNDPGVLGSLSTMIGKHEGNITNLKMVSRKLDFFEMMIDIEVQDVRHLSNIMAALRAMPVISSVSRSKT